MERILVIGASSGIGLEAVKRALEEGLSVRAFSRHASGIGIEDPRLEKVDGNALNRADVDRALAGCDAVIQALGVPLTPRTVLGQTTLFSEATAVLLAAMSKAGVSRLAVVTGYGAGASKGRIPLWQRPAFDAVFGRIYSDKGIQERQIRESDLNWTIARPTILTDGTRSAEYRILTDPRTFRQGRISRADVADFLVHAVKEDTYIHQAPVLTR